VATRRADRPEISWALAGAADVPAVAALVTRAFDPEYREGWSERQLADVLAMPGAWMDLAIGREGGPLAFALCREVALEAELLLCAVDPRWRRQGLGLDLVDRARDLARSAGARRLFLEVRESNRAARSLYGAAGFSEVGRRRDYYRHASGGTSDAITLSIELGG
jgi:ribosomal-protein-alanine N-acetyltransferase